jgi:hypothetical protein
MFFFYSSFLSSSYMNDTDDDLDELELDDEELEFFL